MIIVAQYSTFLLSKVTKEKHAGVPVKTSRTSTAAEPPILPEREISFTDLLREASSPKSARLNGAS